MKNLTYLMVATSLALGLTVAQNSAVIRTVATLAGDGKDLLSIQYDPIGSRVFLSDTRGYTLWNLNGMQKETDYRGKYIRSGSYDFTSGRALLVDSEYASKGYLIDSAGKASEVEGRAGKLFNKGIYIYRDGLVMLDQESGKAQGVAPALPELRDIILKSDGQQILAVTNDKALLYRVNPGQLLKTFGPISGLDGVLYSPNEEEVLLYGDRAGAALFDVSTGMRLADYEMSGDISDAAFSPDGNLIAFSSNDDVVLLWEKESGTIRHKLTGLSSYVSSVAFSPDGKKLAASDGYGHLIFWDTTTGQAVQRFELNQNQSIRDLIFTVDGKYLLSLGGDDTVRVWGVPNTTPFATPAQLTLSSSTPGATAIMDRTPLGALEAAGRTLNVAADVPHYLTVTAPGRLPYVATLTLKAGEERVLIAEPAALTGKATIQSLPTGATVIMDGKAVGKTPFTIENLPDGQLPFQLKFAGYAEYAGQANVQGGTPALVTAVLKELPGLSVKSNPIGATVLIDGKALGVTPLITSGMKPGKYTVVLKLKGYKDQVVSVNIPESGKVNLDITLKK